MWSSDSLGVRWNPGILKLKENKSQGDSVYQLYFGITNHSVAMISYLKKLRPWKVKEISE